ncbi:MAG: four helix bundle protein [Candidatus Bipolaricaulia bacterium]
MESFTKLDVWQKAHELTLSIYQLTDDLPKEEKYRLGDQIRRSASSITANIVEGQARQTTKEYIQFLYQARGSLAETKYHLRLSKDLGYIDQTEYTSLIENYDSVGKMLNGLINSLKEE